MSGSGVLRLLPEAARLRSAFPTPALGPKRLRSHRRGAWGSYRSVTTRLTRDEARCAAQMDRLKAHCRAARAGVNWHGLMGLNRDPVSTDDERKAATKAQAVLSSLVPSTAELTDDEWRVVVVKTILFVLIALTLSSAAEAQFVSVPDVFCKETKEGAGIKLTCQQDGVVYFDKTTSEVFACRLTLDGFFQESDKHEMEQIYAGCKVLLRAFTTDGTYAAGLQMVPAQPIPPGFLRNITDIYWIFDEQTRAAKVCKLGVFDQMYTVCADVSLK